jgi:hypothetical protein
MENCHYHSSKEAHYTCKSCQRTICTPCTILVEGEPYCQLCWDSYVAQVRVSTGNEAENLTIPWPQWKEIGVINAFVDTLGQIAFHPRRFFERLPTKSGFTVPFVFAFICLLLFWYPMNLAYVKLFPSLLQNMTFAEDAQQNALILEEITAKLAGLNKVAYLFRYIFFSVIFASLVQHGMIFLFNGQKGYAATFQIRCYAMAAHFLQIIPIVGIFLAEFLAILLCTRGFQVVQQLSFTRAVLVAILPLLLTFMLTLTIPM